MALASGTPPAPHCKPIRGQVDDVRTVNPTLVELLMQMPDRGARQKLLRLGVLVVAGVYFGSNAVFVWPA